MTAFTVQINCGSGMQSIDTAYRYIRDGGSDLILAGGTEALSYAPLVFRQDAVEFLAALNGADLLQLLPPVPEGQIALPPKWTTIVQHKFLNPQEPLLAAQPRPRLRAQSPGHLPALPGCAAAIPPGRIGHLCR